MHKRLLLAPLLLLLASAGPATSPQSETLPRLAKWIDGGHPFQINNEKVAALFVQDRKEAGDGFHAAALRFVKDDAERHYWVGTYLTAPDYLMGEQADPQFALLLFEQGLAICARHNDEDHAVQAVSLHVLAALTAQRLGFTELARYHKAAQAETIRKDKTFAFGLPALSEDDRKMLDAIPSLEKP